MKTNSNSHEEEKMDTGSDRTGRTPEKSNYGRPFEPPTRRAFIPLPPGAISPRGWLRDWCLTLRDEYTGRLDERDIVFRQAWANDYKMTGESLFWENGGLPYECGANWFDGLVRLGYVLRDDALIAQAKRRMGVVVSNMSPKSILFMWWLDRNNADDVKAAEGATHRDTEWPMWMNGEMGRAMTALYAGSGDASVLRALDTAYTGDRRWIRMGSAPTNVWPAFETYMQTGNKEIGAALTEFFASGCPKDKRWSWHPYTRMPARRMGDECADHGMHLTESLVAWALGTLWTGKREYLDAAMSWNDMISHEGMQPFGAPVLDEHFGPSGAFRGTETCSVACYLWTQIVLLGISGRGALADRIEQAFFNAGPATVSRNGRTHVYFQTPNRMGCGLPSLYKTNYLPIHQPLCCTASLNRILPNYVMHMWMATYDNGLAATCYGPCAVSALVADRLPVTLTCGTDYPFGEDIEVIVSLQREVAFPLSFRIPGWCRNPSIVVNDTAFDPTPDANGFARIQRLWRSGDVVHLRFPMSARLNTGVDRNPYEHVAGGWNVIQPPLMSGAAPYAFASYGPLLFALPIPETADENTPDPRTRWNFALDVDADRWGSEMMVERGPMPAKWEWPVASPLKMTVPAISFDWKPDAKQPLPLNPVASGTSEKIVLIPYGCTKLRVSMFPVSERTWARSNVEKTASLRGK